MEATPSEFIVLYSKYSPQCKRILDIYDGSYSYIKLVCIDNSVIRAKLTDSKILGIQTVPCVLFVYPGGRIEKFEGPDVTDWILEQIRNNLQQEEKTYIDKKVACESESESGAEVVPSKAPDSSFSDSSGSKVTHIGSLTELSGESFTQTIHGKSEEEYVSEKGGTPIPDSTKSVAELAAEMAASREMEDKRLQEQKRQSMTQHVVDDISKSRQADDRQIFHHKEEMAQNNLSYM